MLMGAMLLLTSAATLPQLDAEFGRAHASTSYQNYRALTGYRPVTTPHWSVKMITRPEEQAAPKAFLAREGRNSRDVAATRTAGRLSPPTFSPFLAARTHFISGAVKMPNGACKKKPSKSARFRESFEAYRHHAGRPRMRGRCHGPARPAKSPRPRIGRHSHAEV